MAACLYRYYIDQHEFLYGPLDDEAADAVYQDARKLGTTLQVGDDLWPADRIAFDEFWKRTLDELNIDPPVREHLHGVAAMAFLPLLLRFLAGPFNLFATKGFLAPEFRLHMRMTWTATQQRRFEVLLMALRIADRVIPRGCGSWAIECICGTCVLAHAEERESYDNTQPRRGHGA